jgi:hypothetical protein
MHSFTDNLGRTWCVALNVATYRRVRGVLQLDLCQLVDEGLEELGRFLADPIRLADVLFVLCQEEAVSKNVSDEDFGRALYGDALQAGAEALVEELVDFFPDPRSRAALRKVLTTGRQVRTKLLDQAERMLDELDVDSCASELMTSWTNSRGSSASTPDPLP